MPTAKAKIRENTKKNMRLGSFAIAFIVPLIPFLLKTEKVKVRNAKLSKAEKATIGFLASHKNGLYKVTITAAGNLDNIPKSVGSNSPKS